MTGLRRFLLARASQALIVVAVVVTLAFVLIHAAPGDPFRTALDDPGMSERIRARLQAQYGYDRPLPEQYLLWLSAVAQGNLGWSHSMAQTVSRVLADTLPNTLLLMGTGLSLGIVGGVALGAWQGARHGSAPERATSAVALGVMSVPEFLLAIGVVALFAMRFGWFPIAGMVDPAAHDTMSAGARMLDLLRHLALPSLTLALTVAASVSRVQRAQMLGVLHEDYVRTARAKGAPERTVYLRHALRNALGPLITIIGLRLPALVVGAVFVEKIFAWPGMGRTMVDAVLGRDYALVLGGVVVTSALVTVGSAAADICAALVDPRVGRPR